jgi:hypothetical protein
MRANLTARLAIAFLCLTATAAEASNCDAYCVCGNQTAYACSQYCNANWSALCTDGSCGGFIAGCCCQQFIPGGINFFCVHKKCGYVGPFFTAEEPDETKGLPQQRVTALPAAEEWAYLEYQVNKNLKVATAKVSHASSPAVADRLSEEALAGKTPMQVFASGSYRVFYFRAPEDQPGFGDKRVGPALSLLRVPVQRAVAGTAAFAVRLELAASGELQEQRELFSTEPGLSDGLESALTAFLDQSGLREAGRPLVVVLSFEVEAGRVTSIGISNYLAG